MKKILLPIDGSPRSLRTIQAVKQNIGPEDAELTILLVLDSMPKPELPGEEPAEEVEAVTPDPAEEENARLLVDSFAKMLPGYQVKTVVRRGKPGPEIVHVAEDGKFDAILMTRSSRGPTQKLGSVAAYIVRNAAFITTTVLREAN